MNTNIFIVTVVMTNWLNSGTDFKRESGTNYVKQVQVITTNVFIEEVAICTNRVMFKQTTSDSSNQPTRWAQVPGIVPVPPLPGVMTKE